VASCSTVAISGFNGDPGACNAHMNDELERQLSIMVCAGDAALTGAVAPNFPYRYRIVLAPRSGVVYNREN